MRDRILRARAGRPLVALVITGMLLGFGGGVEASPGVVVFPDSNLEDAIREKLNKPSGDITVGDMVEIGLELRAGGWGIRDLSGLEYAVGLQRLHLQNNEIEDLSVLADLPGLRTLFLDDNRLSDLSPLAGLESLGHLTLSNNEVIDVSPLAGLANLKRLNLSNNPVSDLGPLASLTSMEWLDLRWSLPGKGQLRDISPLAGMTRLTHLYVQNHEVGDIAAVASMGELRLLVFNHNLVSDISPLAGLTKNLAELYFVGNQVEDLGPLADLINLIEIDIQRNRVIDISPLVANSDQGGRAPMTGVWTGALGVSNFVYLQHNHLDLTPGSAAMKDIETLLDRGVVVRYEPQSEDAEDHDPEPGIPADPESVTAPEVEPRQGPCAVAHVLGADHPKTHVLRGFRDERLAGSRLGLVAVEAYYEVSRHVIEICEANPAARWIFKWVLEGLIPVVALLR